MGKRSYLPLRSPSERPTWAAIRIASIFGSGTKDNPYFVSSVADWTEFLVETFSYESMSGMARSNRRADTTERVPPVRLQSIAIDNYR